MALLRAPRQWLPSAVAVLLAVAALSARGTSLTEAEARAALIYNLATFVEWPAPAAPARPLIVGVAGDDLVAAALRALPPLPDGRPIEVRLLGGVVDPRRCDVLYLALDNDRAIGAVLARLGDAPVLTVGEYDRFTQLGGMIRLFGDRDRIRFEVHLGHAAAARLRISSHVLRLASRVRDSDAQRP